jgi:hypothetical protein
MADELEKKVNAADEFCTAAETAAVQEIWLQERRPGIPRATILAHKDGVTEVLDCDERNVDAIKNRLKEPVLRVRGTTMPRPLRREAAGLLERQVNALVDGRTSEYARLKELEGLQKRAKRRAKR